MVEYISDLCWGAGEEMELIGMERNEKNCRPVNESFYCFCVYQLIDSCALTLPMYPDDDDDDDLFMSLDNGIKIDEMTSRLR